MQDKQQSSGVEFQGCAFGNDSEGNVLVGPALRHTVGHETSDIKCSGNGSTLEVLGLAALILGQNSHSDVKPGQTSETTQDKEGQDEVINVCANAERKGCGSRGETEGNL
jgi:hypothetical protein